MADTQIDAQFRQLLGREATPDERAYFGKFIESGELQAQEIGQVLQSTPEYQKAQLNRDAATYGQQLNAQNEAILGQAASAANSRFASLGRPNTSAMGASVLQAGGQLAQQRQSALADFYGQGLRQNAALGARQGEAATARGYGLRDEARRRAWELDDFYRQKNAYEDAKNASSGWKAITPEFMVGQGIGLAGKIGAGYAGGYGGAAGKAAMARGLF